MTHTQPDLVCLSHLRWGFVYQRPQHLLSRFARERRVFFVEEPVWDAPAERLDVRRDPESGVYIAVPNLPNGTDAEKAQKRLLAGMLHENRIRDYVLWYYTPMALGFSAELQPSLVIYDCMDELSAFKGAPPALREREQQLFHIADLVFTGGQTLYESKRLQHDDVHAFPSSVDVPHFAQARTKQQEPADQAGIPHPRIGYCGVIDERMDLGLIGEAVRMRPDWHFVMIGPVVKIEPASLPKVPNIHYLGGKGYKELPQYMSGWDAAMLPFAHNESTRFISPTKTPEYLAAGVPTVSTSIRDVVRPYGNAGLVEIADDASSFVAAIGRLLATDHATWQPRVDAFLQNNSWEKTWRGMVDLMQDRSQNRKRAAAVA